MARNIVITGANRAIGLALVKQYANNVDVVFAVCRQTSAELGNLKGITVINGIDVVNNADLTRLSEILADVKIDILINNAGILTEETLGDIDYVKVTRQFQDNANY
jgi:NAD(P)-dependent dehydrogenase (short-subunit alcohol dehydrogenase family)